MSIYGNLIFKKNGAGDRVTKIKDMLGGTAAGEALAYDQIGSVLQGYDANLDAFAGLTFGENKIFATDGSSELTQLSRSSGSTIATEEWVDLRLLNVDLKDPVHAAITTNIDISSELVNGASLGGVTVVTGNRYILTGQTTASENGIYVAVASGAASRSSDADSSAEVTYGMTAYVLAGTSAGQRVTLTTNSAITLDTTNLTFSITSSNSYTADDVSLALTGTEFSIKNSGVSTAKIAADAVTFAKIQNISQYEVLGRSSAGSGDVEAIATSANVVAFLGAADYSAMRTQLGLVIGTNVQAYDAQLADVAGLTPTDNGVIIGNGTNFVIESGSTLLTSIGAQPLDAQLTDIAGLTPTANTAIEGNGTNFVSKKVRYTHTFVSGDFSAGQLVIAAATHGLGATNQLLVQVRATNGAQQEVALIDITIEDDGDIIIGSESVVPFDGTVVIRA